MESQKFPFLLFCATSLCLITFSCRFHSATSSDGTFSTTAQVSLGWYATCFLNTSGYVKCWGDASNGTLGYANSVIIGDDEYPSSVGYVDLGEQAVQIVSGGYHNCALLNSGRILCWGGANVGQIGTGSTSNIGDDELPSAGTYLSFPETISSLSAGANHTCALSTSGNIYCWGGNASGQLGYNNTTTLGDNESVPSTPITLGATAVQVSAGNTHTCALLSTGGVKCWGANANGQLGYANTTTVGDGVGTNVSAVGEVVVGGTVSQVAAFSNATCALLTSGAVRCWGQATVGQLGYGNATSIGDDENPSVAGDVSLGGTVTQLCVGSFFACALMQDGSVRCWGRNSVGQLGLGNTSNIGDDEVPSSVSSISLGGTAQSIGCSKNISPPQGHACAVMTTGGVRCWGMGSFGDLGLGNTNHIGDDESPSSAGEISL